MPEKPAPSGIAQLRRTVDHNATLDDPMNLDDFIFSTSIASPTGLSPSSATEDMPRPGKSGGLAMPRKKQRDVQQQDAHLAHASAPSVSPMLHHNREAQFGYVQRRVRKTSIDERRVCH